MSDSNKIKRGVSLYSFQEEYFLRKMTLEDILATLADMGIHGIEIIGDQMIPGYPDVSPSFYDNWHKWMAKYNHTPVCLDMFLDWNKFDGRAMTIEEKVDSVKSDIRVAHELGCTVIRVISQTEPEVLAAAADYAGEHNVRLGVEIHSPMHFDHPYIQSLIDIYEKTKSPYLGFVPDMGIFVRRFPRVIWERWVRDGMRPEIASVIVKAYDTHTGVAEIAETVKALGGTDKEIGMSHTIQHFVDADPKRILDYGKYLFHIHAKFYEMLPNYREYSIPYEEVVPIFDQAGFNGYISSEYEGNRHIQDAFEVDSREQVRRQHEMFKELLHEA